MCVRSTSWKAPDEAITNGALDAISLEELREIVRYLLPWLDGKNLARLTNDLIDRAARGRLGWTPATPSEARIGKIERKAGLALREVYAEPAEANALLLEGTYAFLGTAYDAAVRIFRAWLLPLSVGDFHIGQDELLDEMLGVDPATCAAQYVVARYMTAHPASRAQAVWEAIQEVRSEFHTSRPRSCRILVASLSRPVHRDSPARWPFCNSSRVISSPLPRCFPKRRVWAGP